MTLTNDGIGVKLPFAAQESLPVLIEILTIIAVSYKILHKFYLIDGGGSSKYTGELLSLPHSDPFVSHIPSVAGSTCTRVELSFQQPMMSLFIVADSTHTGRILNSQTSARLLAPVAIIAYCT